MTSAEVERAALVLFERYLETPRSQRAAWLAQATRDQPELSTRIEAMIAADHEGQLRTGGAIDQADDSPPPTRIGAYAIVGLIGRGGMGSVYRATRDSDDFAHDVAIKLIKPGLLSEQLDARFRAERRTLAGLRHPNIAQLYDGGQTSDGSPYIVMELVEGAPLLAAADARQMDADARAALFVTICDAVAFAHRNLVVHRDITPSNILVTADGSPKLIDFGISKPAADNEDEVDGASASIGSLSLTPGYAAPERLTSERVTTAADIYSLGKVLAALIHDRDRDLEAIVSQATAPAPGDRYPTAEALAADVSAWRGGHPVAARCGDWRYRLRKFVRRNRVSTAIGTIAGFGLIAAFGLTISAYANAESARRAEAARFAELRDLAGFMLFDLNGSLSRVVGTAQARMDVTNRAQRYLASLADLKDGDPALSLDAARGFVALALIRGVPSQPNLGQIEEARANLAQALDLARRSDAGPAATALIAHTLALRAMIEAHSDNKPAISEATLKQAATTLDRVAPDQRGEDWFLARSRLRRSQLDLAVLRQNPDAMLLAAQRLSDEIAQWPATLRRSRAAELDRATAAHGRGIQLYWIDRFDAALPFIHEADRRFAALDRARPNEPEVTYMRAYNAYLGSQVAISTEGHAAEGDAFLATARATIDRLMAVEPNDRMVTAMAGTIRGAEAQALSSKGRHREALALQTDTVAHYAQQMRTKPSPPTANRLVVARIAQANIARRLNERGLACTVYAAIDRDIASLEKSGELIPYVGNYRPKVRRNQAACAGGAALIEVS